MGCAPSKNTSTVHPINSSNDTVTSNSHLHNRTILVQELPDPPTSTPEPAETTEPTEQFLQPSAAAEIQNKLQDHVNNSSNSSLQSKKPKLQRQSTITDSEEEEEIQPSTYDQNFGASDSNVDSSYFEESCTHMDHLQNQSASNMSNEPIQWKKPPWAVEGACQHSNPTLRLYGTDSQIEFFKMLDKKIEEGPDFHEESESDERT